MKRQMLTVTGALGALAFAATSAVAGGSENCDPDNGQKIFQNCSVCHTNDDSGQHGTVGPNLYDTLGRAVGKEPGYKFSSALRKSGDIWTYEHLDAFLENPMAIYPRTRMAYAGLKKEKDRRDVICVLGKSTD